MATAGRTWANRPGVRILQGEGTRDGRRMSVTRTAVMLLVTALALDAGHERAAVELPVKAHAGLEIPRPVQWASFARLTELFR